jgi:hypothetical protein
MKVFYEPRIGAHFSRSWCPEVVMVMMASVVERAL